MDSCLREKASIRGVLGRRLASDTSLTEREKVIATGETRMQAGNGGSLECVQLRLANIAALSPTKVSILKHVVKLGV